MNKEKPWRMPKNYTRRQRLWKRKQNTRKKCRKKKQNTSKKFRNKPKKCSNKPNRLLLKVKITLLKFRPKLMHAKKKLKFLKSNKPKKHLQKKSHWIKKKIKNQKDRIPRNTKNKMNQNLWMLLKMTLAAKSINPSSNHRKAARKLPPSKSPQTKAGSYLQKLLAIRNIRRLRELLKVRTRL